MIARSQLQHDVWASGYLHKIFKDSWQLNKFAIWIYFAGQHHQSPPPFSNAKMWRKFIFTGSPCTGYTWK